MIQDAPGVIVKVIQTPPKSDLAALSDVLLGSIGLTGVIVLGAILAGFVFASVLFWGTVTAGVDHEDTKAEKTRRRNQSSLCLRAFVVIEAQPW